MGLLERGLILLITLAYFAYFVVIGLHLAFVVLEMALWERLAPQLFGMTPEHAAKTKGLASNQGVYNVFLVAGLLIGFFATNWSVAGAFMLYSLACVIVAGIWGAITVSRTIFYVQAFPAIVAFMLWYVWMP